MFRNVAALLVATGLTVPARAELVLSDLVVELQPAKTGRKDIEIWNNSDERSYVAITPAEIMNPGQTTETRREVPNPESLGLLVSPNRMILEPRQHKVIRVAALPAPAERERVYRVTVKPVVGEVSAEQTGIKLLVGYDVLVMVRPPNAAAKIVGRREGATLVVRNDGNSSAELLNGRQCNLATKACVNLPGKRLYAGGEWRQAIGAADPIEYSVRSQNQLTSIRF